MEKRTFPIGDLYSNLLSWLRVASLLITGGILVLSMGACATSDEDEDDPYKASGETPDPIVYQMDSFWNAGGKMPDRSKNKNNLHFFFKRCDPHYNVDWVSKANLFCDHRER